jgi:hypothetical protein
MARTNGNLKRKREEKNEKYWPGRGLNPERWQGQTEILKRT